MNDCTTSDGLAVPGPSVSTSASSPPLSEVSGLSQSTRIPPCPESGQESAPILETETPDAGFGGEFSYEIPAAPTENFNFPSRRDQIAPTLPCTPTEAAQTPLASVNQILTTIVLDPVEQIPSTNPPRQYSENRSMPKAIEAGPVQVSVGSRKAALGLSSVTFTLALLGGFLAV